MTQTTVTATPPPTRRRRDGRRALLPASAALGALLLLAVGVQLLRNRDLGRGATIAIGLTVGVAGVWVFYTASNALIEHLGRGWKERVRPFLFVAPAVALVGVYLVFPAISTIVTSLTEDGGAADNYLFAFTDPEMRIAFRNNVVWLVLGTAGSVLIGLAFAALVDRVKREALAKTFVFLPMAISLVGASVIWRFIYAWRPPGQPQIGLLNAIWTATGAEPVPFLQKPTVNTLALIVVMIWLQTGFAMVVLSAAIKGVPSELMEAGRIDGASEWQVFRRIIVPSISGALFTVATTICIAILKVFDIVFVTTGGKFDSDVVANRMFTEAFQFRNFGRASALAVVLFIAIIPLMVVNVRRLRSRNR